MAISILILFVFIIGILPEGKAEQVEEIKKIPIATPGSMYFDEKHQRLYVTHPGRPTNNLSIIETDNYSATQISLLIRNPTAIHVNEKTGLVYVLDYVREGKLVIFDTEINEIVKIIPVGSYPSAVITNNEGRKILVVNSEKPSSVSIIDASNFEIVNISLGKNPWSLSLDEFSNKLYVTHPSFISVIDLNLNQVISRIDSVSSSHVYDSLIDSNNNKLFAANYGFTCRQKTGTVMVFDTETEELITNIHVGFLPKSLTMDQNGDRLFVANEATSNISIVELSNGFLGPIVETVEIGDQPIALEFNEKDGLLYVLNSLFLSVISFPK